MVKGVLFLVMMVFLACVTPFTSAGETLTNYVTAHDPVNSVSGDTPLATWDYVLDPNATFSWYDARSGINLTLQLKNNQGRSDRDDGFTAIQFRNFTFNFYGVDYTTMYVGSNGYAGFDPKSDYTISIPGISFPTSDQRFQKIVAPYWDDLDFTSRGAIYFKEFPDDQNPQTVVIEFFKAVHFGNADEVWCEIVLQRDGTILFQYRYVKIVSSSIITGLNDGDGKHFNIYKDLNTTTVDRALAFYRPATLTVTGKDIAPGDAPQGASWIPMLSLNIKTDRGVATIFGIRVDKTGTLPDQGVSGVTLYHDKDHSGNLSAGDLLLGANVFVSGSLTFPLSFKVGASGEDLLILLNLTPSAKAGRTFGLLLKDKGYILTNQFVSEVTFPISTKLVVVQDTLPDTLYISGTNQAPLTVERGRVNVIMLAVVLQASSDYITLTSLNITPTGNATEQDLAGAVLIYDKDRSGGYSGGDVPIAYGKVTSGYVNFTFTFRVENPTQEILLVGYNISINAILGRTIGASLESPGKVTVMDPDQVAPYRTLYSYNSTIVGDTTPPEVQAVQMTPPSPVKAGGVTFTITFSEVMDRGVQPIVSFGLTPPYQQHTVPGKWVTDADWEGVFTITSTTGDGKNTLLIREGADTQGNRMKDDTSHTFIIDTVPPSSNATPLPPETYTASFPIEYTAEDTGAGVDHVELIFRYEKGVWQSYGNYTSSPITFNSTADGKYEFYTIAVDLAGNSETPPQGADASTMVDSMPPVTRVTGLDLYYNRTGFDIPFAGYDNGTGLAYVELFYRISGGAWNIYPVRQVSSPFRFNASSDGLYEFYTIGVDKAGHRERPPPDPDAHTIVDILPPAVMVIYPNGNEILTGGTRVNISWSASDDLGISGSAKVMLSVDGGGTWRSIGSTYGDTLPWDIPANIDSQQCLIRVEVSDLAMNHALDTSDYYFTIASTIPASTALPLPAYMNKSSFDVAYTSFDPKGDGIEYVTLFARKGNGEWFEAGRDSTHSGKIRFTSMGDGKYQFYTVAHGTSNRVEPPPPYPDTSTIVDTTPPCIREVTPKGEFTGTRANVTVFFSESMDTRSVVMDIVPHVNGTFEWSNDNSTLTWRPREDTPARMAFTVYGSARDLAGNFMGKDYTWEIAPPGPPSPWPVLMIIILSVIVTGLLGYIVIRRKGVYCAKCGVRIHSGKYCVKCLPVPEGVSGEVVDGIFLGRPIPPSPEDEEKYARPRRSDISMHPGEEKSVEKKITAETIPPEQKHPAEDQPSPGDTVIGELKKAPGTPAHLDRGLTPRERLQRLRERKKGLQ